MQSAGVQIAGADGGEFAIGRLDLSIVEDAAAEVVGAPALDLTALSHRAGEMPAHGNINERAVRRVRVPAPASDPAVLLPNRAVVPFPGADIAVAPPRNLKQLRRPTAPTVNATSDVQRAGVIASGIKRDVAARRGGSGGLGEGQGGEQQRGDRNGDQEGFTPPPPPIG